MEKELIRLLAGRRGHFRTESGYHSELWFNLDVLFEDLDRLRPFLRELARRLAAHHIEAVCGPMAGGARLARLISEELKVDYFFTERVRAPETSGLFPVKYRLPSSLRKSVRGRSVAIVDDAVSAGSAIRGTWEDLLACGARPVALGALFVFGDIASRFASANHLALESIAAMPFQLWRPEACPLCHAGAAMEVVSDSAV